MSIFWLFIHSKISSHLLRGERWVLHGFVVRGHSNENMLRSLRVCFIATENYSLYRRIWVLYLNLPGKATETSLWTDELTFFIICFHTFTRVHTRESWDGLPLVKINWAGFLCRSFSNESNMSVFMTIVFHEIKRTQLQSSMAPIIFWRPCSYFSKAGTFCCIQRSILVVFYNLGSWLIMSPSWLCCLY